MMSSFCLRNCDLSSCHAIGSLEFNLHRRRSNIHARAFVPWRNGKRNCVVNHVWHKGQVMVMSRVTNYFTLIIQVKCWDMISIPNLYHTPEKARRTRTNTARGGGSHIPFARTRNLSWLTRKLAFVPRSLSCRMSILCDLWVLLKLRCTFMPHDMIIMPFRSIDCLAVNLHLLVVLNWLVLRSL